MKKAVSVFLLAIVYMAFASPAFAKEKAPYPENDRHTGEQDSPGRGKQTGEQTQRDRDPPQRNDPKPSPPSSDRNESGKPVVWP